MKGSITKGATVLLTLILFGMAVYMMATTPMPEGCSSFICAISQNIVPFLMLAFALMFMIGLVKAML